MKEVKHPLAVDEMFPEGAGFMEMEEVRSSPRDRHFAINVESGSSSGILMDLASNEKHVHADFDNDFEDLFDDDDFLPPISSNNE